jgi:hypothetical protein
MNTELDDLYQAILDAINASYDYLPTGLTNYHPTPEELAAQAYYDTLAEYAAGTRSAQHPSTQTPRHPSP